MMTEEQKQALIRHIEMCQQNKTFFDSVKEFTERQKQINEIALAAPTQPASPALKLPDEVVCDGFNPKEAEEARGLGQCEGWNSCIAEVKRLNAPHTAPIEPICATGGAEWVKCSERMPDGEGNDGLLLVCCGGVVKAGFYDQWDKFSDGEGYSFFTEVTHWMPLPAAPKP